jgi:hypothetical protein
MSKIYRTKDRIRLKIDDVTVEIKPLTIDQKTEAQDLIGRGAAKADIGLLTQGVVKAVKFGLVKIEGLSDEDGKPYELTFDEQGVSEDCLNDLFNIKLHEKLTIICSALVRGIPSEFTDNRGQPIEGVEVISRGEGNKNPN